MVQEGVMKIRRAFKKSRKGCTNCKARKVKCDERRPLCGNCARRYIGLETCDFENFVHFSTTAESLPLLSTALTSTPEGCSSSATTRTLELRLMHHYSLFTASQLPLDASGRANQIWAIDIPRFAFSSSLVLHALLGISAQHLWASAPEDAALAHASRKYFDLAVTEHRQELQSVGQDCSAEKAESLLAAAILITHHTWTSAHADTRSQGAPYAVQLQTYHMARGIQALFDDIFPWLKDSAYLWYVERGPVLASSFTVDCPFQRSGRADLKILLEAAKERGGPDHETYVATADELILMYAVVRSPRSLHGTQRRVATLPIRVPARFLELVEIHDPIALALLARNLALLKLVDHAWWLHGEGKHQVAEHAVYGIASLMSQIWTWTMDWPLRLLEGNLPNDV